MLNDWGNLKLQKKFCAVLCGLLILTFLTSSCEPLRKKFTRKKKKEKEAQEEILPILEPIEYPVAEFSPEREYKHRYSLFKIWMKDLSTDLYERGNIKKQLYDTDQLIEQVNKMQELVVEEKKKEFSSIEGTVKAIKTELQTPQPLRNDYKIKKNLDDIDKGMRHKLNFQTIQNSLTQ